MSSRGPSEHSVVAGKHVHVEPAVDLKGCQNDAVKVMNDAAGIEGVRVPRSVNFNMAGIFMDRPGNSRIKALYVEDRVKEPLLKHSGKISAHPAKTEAPPDALLPHVFRKIFCDSEACSSHAHLEREAGFQYSGSFHQPERIFGDLQVHRVPCYPCSPGSDLLRISQALDTNYAVYEILRY